MVIISAVSINKAEEKKIALDKKLKRLCKTICQDIARAKNKSEIMQDLVSQGLNNRIASMVLDDIQGCPWHCADHCIGCYGLELKRFQPDS